MTREQLDAAIRRALGTTLDETTTPELEELLALIRSEGAIRAILDELARREAR